MTILAPTLWPIVFAAAVGASMRAWAQRLAEKGTTLGVSSPQDWSSSDTNATLQVLEQLQGSQSVAGTLRSFWSLRSVSLLNVSLTCIWAFSFLGSRASLRSVYMAGGSVQTNRTYSYANYSLTSEMNDSLFISSSGWSSLGAMIIAIFTSTMISRDATTQYVNGTQGFANLLKSLGNNDSASLLITSDPWRNPRIPRLQSLSGFSLADPYKWIDVPYDTQIVDYASLIGTPIRGPSPSDTGNSTFMLTTSYTNFDVRIYFLSTLNSGRKKQ